MPSVTLYQRLLKYTAPHYKMIGVMLVATGGYALTNAIYASTLKTIVDEGFIAKNMQAIYHTIILLLAVTLFRGVSFFIGNYMSRRVSSDIVRTLRLDMFLHLQRLPSRFFDRNHAGSILSRFNYDVLQVTDAATNAVIILVREGVLVIALLSYLFYQNWRLTLIIFSLVPIIGLVVKLLSKRLRELATRIQGNMSAMNRVLDENVSGQRMVKIYAAQDSESKKFRHTIDQIRNASLKSEIATSLSTPAIEWLIVSVIALLIYLMALQAKLGDLTPGAFLSYTIMMGLLPSPVKKLMRINEYIQRGLSASESIFTFLEVKPEKNDHNYHVEISHQAVAFKGSITFEQVDFGYDNHPILKGFDLRIKAGETVAFVGASGSGKSSLAALIPRFYDIDGGHITIDSIDINTLDLLTLRRQIAFVNQDIVLFDDTVANNIAYGVAPPDEIDEKRLQKAAQMAYAHDFIMRMPQAYDSRIGGAGRLLSGGQKQRIAIARALYKDAPIIILDEATSALDNESENQVRLALQSLLSDRTAIVIAHRLSTVQHADRIMVFDNGRIVEEGNHQTLIAKKGKYFQLHRNFEV